MVGVLNGKFDVSVVTPGCTPGVLNEPVFGSVIRSPSDAKDTVVEVDTAGGSGEDSTGVLLEGSLVGLNGDGDWSLFELGLECISIVLSDISVGSDLEGSSDGGVACWSVSSSRNVWVLGFGWNGVALGPGEGLVHETSIASHVLEDTVVTGDEFLLGVGFEVSSGNEVGSLKSTGGGE